MAKDSKARDWSKRTSELMKDQHLIERVQRIMEPLRLIHGTKDVGTFDEVLQIVAQQVAALELHPDIQQTSNHGGIIVTRGPMQGYGIVLHAADVYVMHMGNMQTEGTVGERNWRKANEFWKAGQEAQVSA